MFGSIPAKKVWSTAIWGCGLSFAFILFCSSVNDYAGAEVMNLALQIQCSFDKQDEILKKVSSLEYINRLKWSKSYILLQELQHHSGLLCWTESCEYLSKCSINYNGLKTTAFDMGWGMDSRPYILLWGVNVLLKGNSPTFPTAALIWEEGPRPFSPFLSERFAWVYLIYLK